MSSSVGTQMAEYESSRGSEITSQVVSESSVHCVGCGVQIAAVRRKARPDARHCVPCLERAGDVPVLRRYDESVGDDIVSTYFKTNPRVERQLLRVSKEEPTISLMQDLVGDDSFLLRAASTPVSAESLGQAIKNNPEE